MPWRSEIWAGLELDFGSDRETLNPEAEAWIERIVQEPWVAALLRLVEKDAWVGTEERLLDELKVSCSRRGVPIRRHSQLPRRTAYLHRLGPRGLSTSWTSMFWTTATYRVIP